MLLAVAVWTIVSYGREGGGGGGGGGAGGGGGLILSYC
jgi:hypothetical protein